MSGVLRVVARTVALLCAAAACTPVTPGETVTDSDASEGTSGASDGSDGSDASAGPTGGGSEASSSTDGSDATTQDPTTQGATTGDVEPGCGNGILEDGEACDEGEANADDAACTSACELASCGDGLLHLGVEICDHGPDNGGYDACREDCLGFGPHCGDGVVQPEHEDCDAVRGEGDGLDGSCLSSCRWAESCLALIADQDDLSSGMYAIRPPGVGASVDVYCDMQTNGGGYTFAKYDLGAHVGAAEAEAACASLGLRLLTPRSKAHLSASAVVAANPAIPPTVGSTLSGNEYLSILAIYPVVAGESCVDQPLNAEACPAWAAGDGMGFWATQFPVVGQPATSNCEGCSMAYAWSPGGELVYYEAFSNGGVGATSRRFVCMAGDKLP